MTVPSYPPPSHTISIPAVVAGNILMADDTSVQVNDNDNDGTIIMKTDNTLAMIIDNQQRVSINTELFESQLTINNDHPTTSTIRLSYLDSFYFDGMVTANGNPFFQPSCIDPLLNPNLSTVFGKNLDIKDHNGSTLGLKLHGIIVTSTATQLNYNTVTAGTATASKSMVLDSNKSITGVNNLGATTLAGTLTTGIQHGITEVDTLNIQTQLSLQGVPFTIDPAALSYLDVSPLGVAQPSKALIVNSSRSITNINNLSASTLTGMLTAGTQPNITTVGTLNSLTVGGVASFGGRVTITSTQHLRLKYDNSNYVDIDTSPTGDLVVRSTGGNVIIDANNNFNVYTHNGSTIGLMLGGTLVRASAAQLNFNAVTAGTAAASKALVLDASKNVTGANLIGATSFAGTIITGSQPNITSVGVLNIVNHNGNTTGLSLAGTLVTASAAKINYIDTTPGSAQASKAIVLDNTRSVSNIGSLTADNLYGTIATNDQPNITSVTTLRITGHNGTEGLTLGATLVTSSGTQLNYVDVLPGVSSASKALVVDSSKNISGIGALGATTLAGTLLTGPQPNISSVNILNVSTHNGSTQGLSLGGVLVLSTAAELNRVHTTAGVADVGKALVVNNSKNISGINALSAVTLTGLLLTGTQPNIKYVQSIDVEDHNGSTTGLTLGGVLVQSTAAQLNTLTVNPGTAASSKALVLNSSGNISGINTLSATNINGTIQTGNQPNIYSVNVLDIASHNSGTLGLSLGGTLIVVSGDQINKLNVLDGTAAESKALILNVSKSISGINVLSANTLNGTLGTAAQPNISSVNILNISTHNGSTQGLSLGGTLVTATATELNRVDTIVGSAVANKAVILNNDLSFVGINNLSATTINGTLTTVDQPNITSVQTLNIAGHDAGSHGLRLGGTLVAVSANQMNYNSVVPGTASSTHTMVTNEFNSIHGINEFSATKLVAEQLALSGVISNFNTGGVVIKSYSMTNLIGRMVDIQLLESLVFTNFQPADMANMFSSEIIGYILPQYSETYTFFVNCNDRVRMWVNDVLILHSWGSVDGFRTTSSLFLNAGQWVKIYIQYQVDSSSSLLNVEWSSSTNGRTSIPSNRLAWDSNQPSNDSNHYTQNSLTIYNSSTIGANTARLTVDTGGDLVIDASGNDITLGIQDNFNIPSHDGVSSGLYLAGVRVQPTAFELNYLKITPGATTASKAIVVDGAKSITGINSIACTSLSCTNLTSSSFTISDLTLSGPLNNYNTGSLLIRQITGPDVSGRIVDVDLISDINLSNYDPQSLNTNYSLDIIGFVKPAYTEVYKFYAIANDRVRIWVNNVLVLNVWDSSSGLEYTSDNIQLTAGLWTSIYIQFQNLTGGSSLQVRWSSTTLTKSFITPSDMAWDNSVVRVPKPISTADSITLFSSQSGLLASATGTVSVDSTGSLNITAKSGTINIASANDFNIVSHNGSRGLYLAGTLVTSTAAELNRVSGVSPGTVTANKAIILDGSKSISGLTTITSDNLYGLVRTPDQPYITSIGTLAATLSTSSDVIIGATTKLRLLTDSTTSFIQSGATNTTDSAADLFIGNYGASTSVSSRKFMIKASGATGIQTNTPNKMLSVNAAGASYAMRLINNNATGAETNYTDFGTNSSGNLSIETSGTSTNLLSNLLIGKTSPATLSVSSGVLNVTSTSGCVQIGNASNTAIPLEIGSTTFSLSGTIGYLNSSGSCGATTTTPTTYSMRTTGSIIVNGTVCITSDRRLKQDIVDLDIDRCKQFILKSSPVSFAYSVDPNKTRLGLVAQDIAKSEFKELVQFTPDSHVQESVDADGFVSPDNASMNVSYTEIIPILMSTIKDLYKKNEALETKLTQIYEQLNK